ncbi:helix-turn-helix transcriptional regulator [Enterovirga rhinocerotis]|uniref:AraC family transcriptional regulator n=1 Tax=Enterovirga rhinocerotis TaxID=1339210 RepID=A0A4R7BN39_9HYPH|nr:helix-turn-helix transcriptional regulator [Enterovirga rhinocerotis]TDR85337.1 AraC family transcriptional regulator [Enterovirga rhinocerotis]
MRDRGIEIGEGSADGPPRAEVLKRSVNVVSTANLREATLGADIEMTQLRSGEQHGRLAHVAIDQVALSLCRFGIEVRARGVLDVERAVLGVVLSSSREALFWGEAAQPGDVVTFPPGIEADAVYKSALSYAAISVDPQEVVPLFAHDGALGDPDTWLSARVRHTEPLLGVELRRRLIGLSVSLRRYGDTASAQSIDFARRSIIEAFGAAVASGASGERSPAQRSAARIVRDVEEYVDAAADRPVHLSEICTALQISRRSLHRAFANTLGLGPVAYLRRRRLSLIEAILRRSDARSVKIAQLAFEYGFPEPSRFTSYYRALFGVTPSHTRRRRFEPTGFGTN